jgi:CheY-like chemotaxis protein
VDIVPAWQVLAAAQRSPLTGSAGPAPAAATRVLVVEDEPTVARLISDVLEDEGFQVEALLDGYEALERAARASYDLVICDMKMPGLHGESVVQTISVRNRRRAFLAYPGILGTPQSAARRETFPGRGAYRKSTPSAGRSKAERSVVRTAGEDERSDYVGREGRE